MDSSRQTIMLRSILTASAFLVLPGANSEIPDLPSNCSLESPEQDPLCELSGSLVLLQRRGRVVQRSAGLEPKMPPAPPDGTYLLKLLFMRHGMSCANVAWEDCTTDAAKIERFMKTKEYKETLGVLDKLMKEPDPTSVGGINRSYGIKVKGTVVEGQRNMYMTSNRAHECTVKALSEALGNDDFDEDGNIIGLSPLVKDPHITHCALGNAKTGSQVLSKYLDERKIELDLVGASTLKRAIESAELMFQPGRLNSSRHLRAVTTLPFLNERDPGTPTQPECYPSPVEEQLQQMRNLLGPDIRLEADLVSGGKSYPRTAQQYDKFKAVLALNVLPFLHADRRPIQVNPELAAALSAKNENGLDVFPEESSYKQVTEDPILEVDAGHWRYEHASPFARENYLAWKAAGAQEFVLGLGSHSVVIKRYCMEDSGDYVNNYAVVEKLIAVNVTTENGKTTFTVAEGSGKCRRIMDAPPSPAAGSLTASDLGENCKIPFDIRPLIDTQPEPRNGPTECITRGSTPGAFPLYQTM